jgi:integral membrane sensor domain MASE1
MPTPEAGPHGPLCDHPYAGTVVLALAYWGLSHLAWMAFHALGVLPLPIWPAAGLAFAVAIHGGWRVAPGLALGAFLANLVSLGAPWAAAAGICVMNSVGPVLGAALLRRQVTRQLHIRSVADLLICLGIAIVLVPMLTAVGGVGTTWLFGLTTTAEAPIRLAKWIMAHATGTVLVGVPLLIWLKGRNSCV